MYAIIWQQQKQLVAIQAQLQALAERGTEGAAAVAGEGNTEVARPQVFDGASSKVSGFVTVCKLYIRMKMRGISVKE